MFQGKRVLDSDIWSVVAMTDGCDLFCTLTRSALTFQLYSEVIGQMPLNEVSSLFDVEKMLVYVEEEIGLCMSEDHWERLLESAVVHHL